MKIIDITILFILCVEILYVFFNLYLAKAGVEFKAEFYADEDHSIRSTSNINKHIYKKILLNLLECFDFEWRN